MSVLTHLYDWLHPKPVEPPTTTGETQLLAEQALAHAMNDLAEAKSRSERVAELVTQSEKQLRQNHFAALVEASMRGSV